MKKAVDGYGLRARLVLPVVRIHPLAKGGAVAAADDVPLVSDAVSGFDVDVEGHRCAYRIAKAGFGVLTITGPSAPIPFHIVVSPSDARQAARDAVAELRAGRSPKRGVFRVEALP